MTMQSLVARSALRVRSARAWALPPVATRAATARMKQRVRSPSGAGDRGAVPVVRPEEARLAVRGLPVASGKMGFRAWRCADLWQGRCAAVAPVRRQRAFPSPTGPGAADDLVGMQSCAEPGGGGDFLWWRRRHQAEWVVDA